MISPLRLRNYPVKLCVDNAAFFASARFLSREHRHEVKITSARAGKYGIIFAGMNDSGKHRGCKAEWASCVWSRRFGCASAGSGFAFAMPGAADLDLGGGVGVKRRGEWA